MVESPVKQVRASVKQFQSKGDEVDSDMDDVGIEGEVSNFTIAAKNRLKRTPPRQQSAEPLKVPEKRTQLFDRKVFA